MSTQIDLFDNFRKQLERSLNRTGAAVEHTLRPQSPQLGKTPKEVVWTKNKAKLYRYHQANQRHATPLLLVYALINKPYILDLTPGNSLVEYLVSQGYDVYLLDWGTPGEEDAGLRLDDYVMDYMHRAVKQVLKSSGQAQTSLLGYCQGGVLATCYTATHPETIKNFIALTTPFDFTDAGLYTNWLNPKHFNVDRVADSLGLVPASFLDLGGKLLKPMQNTYGTLMTLLDKLDDATFVASWQVMDRWVNDGVPFPGEAYRKWIKEFYQQNKLVKGEITMKGEPVKLENIKCAVLNVYAELDHIVLPNQAKPLLGLIGSTDKQEMVVRAGHVGVVAGRAAKQNFFPKLESWLSARSGA
jgi:polyhydroxyalkanoate synthase